MLTAALCRAQEAHQLTRAAAAVLDNVRDAATRAAAAWNLEAVAAERREHQRLRPSSSGDSRLRIGDDSPFALNVRLGPEAD